MAEVGTYYITIMPDMSKFTGAVNKAMSNAGVADGNAYVKSFGDIVRGSALGTLLGNVAGRVGDSIMSGLSTGIDRADTLRNFPRVMEAMGFEAGDAEDSIKKIMERLRGLPASTQDVVRLTQAISDSTGDVGLATDASLAFTDAMIAQGASAAEVQQAQGVLNRVLGKGSATVAQWGSLTAVMTPQLNAAAEALLGTGASAEDLHAALENGTVTWDDFLRTMVDLDQNGLHTVSRDMASFEEQARANSDGIGTAIQNMGWRIGSGWAEIINAIGVSNISGPINAMADFIQGAMSKVGEAIKWVKDLIDNTGIADSLKKIGGAIGEAFAGMWTENDVQLAKDFTTALVDLIDKALSWLADHGDVVKVAIWGIIGAITGIMAFNLGTKLAAIPGILTGIWTVLAANPFVAIAALIGGLAIALYNFFTQTETGKAIWEGFCQGLSDLWEGLKTDFQNMVDTIKQNLEDNKVQWERFKENVSNAIQNVKTTVTTVVEGIKTAIVEKFKSALTTAINAFNTAKATITTIVTNIKTTVTNGFESAKTNVTNIVTNIRDAITNGFNAAKDKALGIFDNIKNGIKEKVQWAYDQISSIVERIKGLFNFSWSLPKPSLPHITWSWQDVGGIVSIPSFGVDWYAKGGVFDAATLIGVGEKGREAVLPLNDRSYGEIAGGIANKMGGEGGVTVEKLADTIIIREEVDADRFMDRISQLTSRERRSQLWAQGQR